MSNLSVLTDPSLAIIFEASPLGLGHLRVTDALYHGLPHSIGPILLGAQAPKSSAFYRFASTHESARTVLEMLQLPPLDQPVAAIGRVILRKQTKYVYEHLKAILNQRFTVPQTVLLVATHAVHAHPLGAIKERLRKELGMQVYLVVQVTDDSPQAIWYVPDADIIFVPSEYTKAKLQAYGKKARLPEVPFVVTAYPISPILAEAMTEHKMMERKEQLDPSSQAKIHVSVPISGAAVGTEFVSGFVRELAQKSARYDFHIVVREAGFTQAFIQQMSDLPYTELTISTHELGTVDNYEKVFKATTIALEITKPSEQAFKVLATPRQRGGVIMLFCKPVGGQEYDNVRFLHTHGLIPTEYESRMLWQKAKKGELLENGELLQKAAHWRGVLLPENSSEAAAFTDWCLRNHIFASMLHFSQSSNAAEVQSNGVEQFWMTVAGLITRQNSSA